MIEIELEEYKSDEICNFIKTETGCTVEKIWTIKTNDQILNINGSTIIIGSTINLNSIATLAGITLEEYIEFLYKHGADCYLVNFDIKASCEVYFSNYKVALKAVKKLEALMVMNKLTE